MSKDKATTLIAKLIVSLLTLFLLPLTVMALIQNPLNYWAWVGTILLARPIFRKVK